MKLICLLQILTLTFCLKAFGQTGIDTVGFQSLLHRFSIQNSMVCLGEAHEIAGTNELEIFIIDELIKKGHRFIIIEGGLAESTILNQYMITGDENLLYFTRARGSNYRKLITRIREINEHIRFIGVDFERGVCLEYIFNTWLKNIKDPALQSVVKNMKSINGNTSAKRIKDILLNTKADFVKHEQGFEVALGSNAKTLKQILFNPVFLADYGLFSSQKRDRAILQNLLSLSDSVLTKSILIFGSNHFTNNNHFIDNYLSVKEQKMDITIILFTYYNCTNYLKSTKYYSAKPLSAFIKDCNTTKPEISFEEKIGKTIFNVGDKNKLIIAKLVNQ